MDTESLKEPARAVGAIGEFIREQREQAHVSLRQLARLAGVSNPYLSQIERGLRRPSADILQQIAKGLQISAEQLYIRAGILQTRFGDPDLVAAILADTVLTERQKQAMLEIYESFRRENAQALAESKATPAETRRTLFPSSTTGSIATHRPARPTVSTTTKKE